MEEHDEAIPFVADEICSHLGLKLVGQKGQDQLFRISVSYETFECLLIPGYVSDSVGLQVN